MRRPGRYRKSFTLIEILIVAGVFAVLSVQVSSVVSLLYRNWSWQGTDMELQQQARWAVEFMVNELRRTHVESLLKIVGGASAVSCDGNVLSACDGISAYLPDSARGVYYWRDGTVLYRGEGTTFSGAITNRQKLADMLYYNAANNTDVKGGLFASEGSAYNLYHINMTLQDSTYRQGQKIEYKVSGSVRSRN